ncbi:vWA domain-containing protein [Microbulbifer sp. SSSA005]|uniref:vWA domain-containing protein n=1 Tax=unclassified Microbulbifer TaxID=2619833 RepID=UPI0040395B92
MSTSKYEQLTRISTKILLHEPFYGHFMLGMPKSLDECVDTACVSLINKQVIKLSINPQFWASLSENHQYGLIKHELLHVVFRHLFAQREYSNKTVFNIAADLAVNQYIKQEQLPKGAITLDKFFYLRPLYGISLEPMKSAKYYYQKLMDAIKAEPFKPISNYENQHGKITPLTDLISEDNQEQKKHKSWQEFSALNPSEIKVMEYQLHGQVKHVMNRLSTHQKAAGHLPSSLTEYLKSFLEEYKPQVDWKRTVKRFAASSNSTFIKNTLRRPSKRYGTTPGIKVRRHQRILVALDTSASVPIDYFDTFFGELHQIWKNGAEVIITECDANIQKTYKYLGVKPEFVHGRGGTSFNPPIQLANQEIHPDGIIYFTDGGAPIPSYKSRCPILWVIVPEQMSDSDWSHLPGQTVVINS